MLVNKISSNRTFCLLLLYEASDKERRGNRRAEHRREEKREREEIRKKRERKETNFLLG